MADQPGERGDARRRTYLRGLAAGATIGVAGCGNDERDGSVTPATIPLDYPFSFRRDGEIRGFEIALTDRVVRETPHELGGWRELNDRPRVQAVVTEWTDVVAATIANTVADGVTLSTPYYSLDQAFLLAAETDDDPTEPRHLRGRRVGVRAGAASEPQLRRLLAEGVIEPSDVRQYDGYPTAADALVAGDVHAVIADRPVARVLADRRPVRIAFVESVDRGYGYLLRDDDDRRAELDRAIESVVGSEGYDELIAEWFLRSSRASRG